jgi:hypothetical protein
LTQCDIRQVPRDGVVRAADRFDGRGKRSRPAIPRTATGRSEFSSCFRLTRLPRSPTQRTECRLKRISGSLRLATHRAARRRSSASAGTHRLFASRDLEAAGSDQPTRLSAAP